MHNIRREQRAPVTKSNSPKKVQKTSEAVETTEIPVNSENGVAWKKWLIWGVVTLVCGNVSVGLYLCARAQFWGTIFDAAEWGYTDRIEQLLAQGESITQHRAVDGNTLLHIATDSATIDFLVEHGANIEGRNQQGLTPLGFLLANRTDDWGNNGALRSLLSNGASAKAAVDHKSGKNALMLLWSTWKTISKYRYNNTVLLIEFGATPSHQDKEGETVYHYFGRRAPTTSGRLSHMALSSLEAMQDSVTKTMTSSPRSSGLKQIADPTIKLQNKNGFTPLMELMFTASPFASSNDIVMNLVERWATKDVLELKDQDEGTAICYAAFKGLKDPLKYLLNLVKQDRDTLVTTMQRYMPYVMSCAVLSPAHELNFEAGGVVDTLVKVGIPVIKHHLDLFEQVWEGKQMTGGGGIGDMPWSPLELKLMSENAQYQKYYKPEATLLNISKEKMVNLLQVDTYHAASHFNQPNSEMPPQTQ